MQSPTATPRVAFGTLVETGYIQAGTMICGIKRRWKVNVRADGSVLIGDDAGSIHKLGATVQGAPSCNGWTLCHYESAQGIKPIDALEQTYLLAAQP